MLNAECLMLNADSGLPATGLPDTAEC